MRRRASLVMGSVAAGALLAGGLTTAASAAEAELAEPTAFTGAGTEVWQFDERDAYDATKREPTIAPRYLIYPDHAVDATGAKAVLEELGLDEHLNEYATRAWVINPTDGVGYDEDADLASYFSFMSALPKLGDHQHTNLKVIGIGDGATFVNNVVSQNAWSLAGIFTYGGEMDSAVTPYGPSPAYVQGDAVAGERYVAANDAELVDERGDLAVYADPDQPLARVVVDSDDDETLAEAFASAWDELLGTVYRPYFASGAPDPAVIRDGYPLVTYPRIGEGAVTQTPVTDALGTDAEYMWQEYVPASVLDAADGTVPLVIAMHGSTDMPQHIVERSGWVEQIADAGAILVSTEIQGSRFGYANFDAAATERLVAHLAEKFPQIDTSRVFGTGFSLGGMNLQSWGTANPGLFTAIAVVSAPSGPGEGQVAEAQAAAEPNHEVPLYMLQGVEDVFGTLPVSSSARSVFHVVRSYGALDGVEVPAAPDLTANPFYGVALDDQGWQTMGINEAFVGTLSNERGVVIKLAAVDGVGHVSYAPSAADIWDFFSDYRRDTTTGELVFVADEVVDATADASVRKLKGNQNELTITVTETKGDGSTDEITAVVLIRNNAAGTYQVGDYAVYVDTKGNTQVRDVHIVD